VRATTIFTTHTPVPAGHDVFPIDLIERYFASYYTALGIDRTRFLHMGANPEQPEAGFNMTALALRLSAHHNGVSRANGAVASDMWRSLWHDGPGRDEAPADYVTNGVHLPTWLNTRMQGLYNRYIGPTAPGGWRSTTTRWSGN